MPLCLCAISPWRDSIPNWRLLPFVVKLSPKTLFAVALLVGGLFLGGLIYLWMAGAERRNGGRTGEMDELEVIKWMESGARAERAFERAWRKTPEDPEVYRKLERAIAIQAELRDLDPEDSFGSVSRYEMLVRRLETTKGKFLRGRVRALAGEASELAREGHSVRARVLLEEALAAQEWINQRLQSSEFADVGEVANFRQRLGDLESENAAEAIDLLVAEGEAAYAGAHWDKAEEHWSRALALQESFNFHSPQSRHARWRLVQEMKDNLQRVQAARLNDRIETLLKATEEDGSVEDLERALILQEEVNEKFPSGEFNQPERLDELRNRLLIGQSSALAASISRQIGNLNESLRDGKWETVGSLLGSLDQSVRSFLESFPSSLLPDSTVPQRIEWLSQREEEIPALVEEVEKRLVRHHRIPGLRLLVSEVDQALYSRIMGNNPSRWMGDELPVDSVSFNQAQVFCRQLGWMMGRNVQLPSLQWLTIPELQPGRKEKLWLSHSAQFRSRPVGSSRLVGGLFDLYGNLEEWVLHPDQRGKAGLFGGNGSDTFDAVIRRPVRWLAPHFRSRWTGFRFLRFVTRLL